ncbi:Agamous-like MADS-box protein [Dirofilaria immitis]
MLSTVIDDIAHIHVDRLSPVHSLSEIVVVVVVVVVLDTGQSTGDGGVTEYGRGRVTATTNNGLSREWAKGYCCHRRHRPATLLPPAINVTSFATSISIIGETSREGNTENRTFVLETSVEETSRTRQGRSCKRKRERDRGVVKSD